MLRYLTIPKFSAESGYTQNAIRSKIRDGIWTEGSLWRRAPDGRILIDVLGYEQWVESAPILKVHRKATSKALLPLVALSTRKKMGSGSLPLK